MTNSIGNFTNADAIETLRCLDHYTGLNSKSHKALTLAIHSLEASPQLPIASIKAVHQGNSQSALI
jgi:hypothetical protein